MLEKSAKEAVAGMALSAANYSQAIEALKHRFSNKEKIVNCHMESLVSMDGVQSDDKLRVLRKLYDRIEMHIRSLQTLDVKTEMYGSLLCPILVKKLPPNLKLNVNRRLLGEEWNVDGIMKIVLEELESREWTEGVHRGESKAKGGESCTQEQLYLVEQRNTAVTADCLDTYLKLVGEWLGWMNVRR